MSRAEENYQINMLEEVALNQSTFHLNNHAYMSEIARELTQVGSWYIDIATMTGAWSHEMYAIHDIQMNQEPVLSEWLQLFTAESSQQFEIAIQKAIEVKKAFDLELEIVTHKGQHKWIRNIGRPVIVGEQVIRIEGAVQDITHMKVVLNQAEEQESVMESFFEAIPDLYFVIDEDGTILDYRAKKDSFLYVSPTQFLHKRFDEVLPPDVAALFPTNIQTALEKKEMVHFEYSLELPDGKQRFECRLNKLPERDRCIAVVRNITEQYRVSQAMMISEERYRNLLEKAPFPIVITKMSNGHLCYANQRAKNQFGFSESEELDVPATRFYYRLQDREILLERLKHEGTVRDLEIMMVDWKGNPFWALISASEVEFEQEPAFLVAINDITARKQVEGALKESEEKYRLLAEYTSDVIWVLNFTQKRFTYVSPSVEHLTGFTVEEVLMQTLEEALTPESLQSVVNTLSEEMKQFIANPTKNNSYILEVQQPCKNGQLVWVEFSLKFRYNAQCEIEIFGVSRNIDERKKMENEVLYLSYHDQLTGLYNRRYYEEQLEIIDRPENLPISLIMADVNGLKLTNDAFGHLVGDRLLTAFSEVLKKECRKSDIMARVGGDEFVILLPNTGYKEAEKLVNRIQQAISNKMVDQINLSVSFGWKTKSCVDQSFNEIYKQAEDYMYRQKLFEGKSFKGETIKIIIKTLYEKYPAEKSHGERVSDLCRATGVALGLSENEVNELGMAGLLHDIGKIGLEENVLDKPGKFNEEDWRAVKRHPEIGYQILRSVTEFADIAEAVLAHHERPDGKGYPKGLKAESIPHMSKIVAIADAFDAMTSTTVYRVGMTVGHAVQELKRYAGTQFDEKIVRVFVEKVLDHSWE